MTIYEKLKSLSILDMARIIEANISCADCPIFKTCELNNDLSCYEKWEVKLQQENEGEVEKWLKDSLFPLKEGD